MNISLSLWQRMRRTPYQAIAAVFMIFITLVVTSIFLLLASGSSALLTYLESKPQLTIFFKDEKDATQIDTLVAKLKSTNKVSTYEYISKDQALNIYREQNKNDPLLLEMVTADILPASLEISAISPKYLGELRDVVKDEPGIDEVVYQKDIVDTLVSWTTTLRKVGFIFIFFLLSSTFFILLTSIGMKIALKKEEIEILKLVGATPWYIKRPFILEGVSYGIIGATLSWISVSVMLLYVRPFVSAFLKGIDSLLLFKFENFSLYIWPPSLLLFLLMWLIVVIFGIIIGFFGSLLAVERYMKATN